MTWNRRLLKTNAKKSLKQNYWRSIAVCFLIALIGGTSLTTTQLLGRNQIDEFVREFSIIFNNGNSWRFLHEGQRILSNWLENASAVMGALLLFASVSLWALFKIFVSNVIRVGTKRFFMETRMYPKTSIGKIGYLYKGRDVTGPAWIMLCMYVYRFFWCFTIVGGIIKTYEYAMIPYILAENPDISKKDAFALSKEMMRGNKWRLFVLRISFILWSVLGIITMGLSNIFYTNAYRTATETELYMEIRRGIVSRRNKFSKFFIDNYLENRPSEDEILINMFVTEKDYTPSLESEEFSQKIYPMFLRDKDSKWYEPPFKKESCREYHITTYIMIFFLTSVIGWMMELTTGILKQGQIIHGNLVVGPWLPIVGVASVLILIIGRKLERHPLINVTFITVFASAVHYFYVWIVESVLGVRYWDFTDYLLNLNGRICLASAIVLGIAGSALFYLIGPMLNDILKQFPTRKKWKWCIALGIIALVNILASGYILFLK